MKDLIDNSKAIKILIDHHENPKEYADYLYSDTRISSTLFYILGLIYY